MPDDLVTVEYWPHTAEWRILVAGVPVGYWASEEEAETRARQARRALAARVSGDEPSVPSTISHNCLEVFCAVPGCGLKRAGRSHYCKKHDMRARRGKDPAIDRPRGRPWKEQ